METNILNNIYRLYRSQVITLIVILVIGFVMAIEAIIIIKDIKNEPMRSRMSQITLIVIMIACWSFWIFSHLSGSLIPIHKDYKESSYVILENAVLTVTSEADGYPYRDATNTVVVEDSSGRKLKLKMLNDMLRDYDLSFRHTYTGTFAYTVTSGYVVWCSLS